MDEYPKGKYDACFLYSGSSYSNQWECFPKRYIFHDWTEKSAAHLQSILRKQKELEAVVNPILAALGGGAGAGGMPGGM